MPDHLNPFSVLLEVAATGRKPELPVPPVVFQAPAPELDDTYWDSVLDENWDD